MVPTDEIKKIKNKCNKIINSMAFAVIIGIILMLKTMFFYNNTIAITQALEIQTILGTAVFAIVIAGIISILPNRARVITGTIINLLISILLFADNLYYSFSSNVLSVAQIGNLQYGNEIMATIPTLLRFKYILYFIDIIIMLILILFKEIKIEKIKENTKKKNIIKALVAFITIFVFCFMGLSYIEKGSLTPYNKEMQIKNATIYGYHISDIVNAINFKNQAKYKTYDEMISDYNKLKDSYEEKYGEIKYNFNSLISGKNIIVLQLESVQEFVVNKKINGKEITPNLNKFLNENIEFSNMHMQSYSTTADSEHTVITSTYPMENGMSFSKYFTNTYDDIFKMYNENNYYTAYMHGNFPYFWNRGNVYGRLNLSDLVFKDNFEDTSENINGDLSDELLYKQAVPKIKTYDTPFFVNIVSASSHTPFLLNGLQDRSKVSIDVGKYKNTYFGNYLESMNYADYAFGLFIEDLKKENLYDDTVILVFGDHNGLSMYDEEMLDFLRQVEPNINDVEIKLNYTRVLCGLKLPGVHNLKIDKPINKLDIKPTFAYLNGFEDGLSLGTNMFKSKDFVCLNNEKIITDKYYYDGEWYEIETGKKVDLETLDTQTKQKLDDYYNNMKTELDISISISINDLLNNEH